MKMCTGVLRVVGVSAGLRRWSGRWSAEITRDEFRNRRRNLVHALLREPSKLSSLKTTEDARHLILLDSAPKKYMVDKIPYLYRPSSDFRYLSGHTEPEAALVMEIFTAECKNGAETVEFKTVLFTKVPNAYEEKWDGRAISQEESMSICGVDEVKPTSELHNYLKETISEVPSTCLWHTPLCSDTSRVVRDAMDQSGCKVFLRSLQPKLHEIRLIKSSVEIELLRQSCSIASSAINQAMASTLQLESEAQIFATLDYHCRMEGASYLAYPPVVASGEHATTIHYVKNSHKPFVNRNDLVLVDVGCEFAGYSSDVTRTWPLSGTFQRPAQRLVYNSILDVHMALLRLLGAGGYPDGGLPLTIDALYHEMQRLFMPHLVDLGLLSKDVSHNEAELVCSEVCPHHVSHYLGMDVHDTHLVPKNTPLVPGMVITLEPGLYFPRHRKLRGCQITKELAGIGGRIEDDILITLNDDGSLGCEVFTKNCPTDIADLEKLISSQ